MCEPMKDSTWFAVKVAEHRWAGYCDGLPHVRGTPARDVVPDTPAGWETEQRREGRPVHGKHSGVTAGGPWLA